MYQRLCICVCAHVLVCVYVGNRVRSGFFHVCICVRFVHVISRLSLSLSLCVFVCACATVRVCVCVQLCVCACVHRLDHGAAFVDKVRSLASAHWGMSTDFAKAMRKIAEMVCSERLEQHDVPDLLVVSDMQFDQARFEGGYGDYFGYGKVHSAWDTVL